jgi:hypothetical protein
MGERGAARLPPELSNFYCLPGRAGGTPLAIRFVPSLIAVRFARRTGATVKIAMATASCAVTAALAGSWTRF